MTLLFRSMPKAARSNCLLTGVFPHPHGNHSGVFLVPDIEFLWLFPSPKRTGKDTSVVFFPPDEAIAARDVVVLQDCTVCLGDLDEARCVRVDGTNVHNSLRLFLPDLQGAKHQQSGQGENEKHGHTDRDSHKRDPQDIPLLILSATHSCSP